MPSTAPRSPEANIYHHTLLGPHIRGDKVALWDLTAGAVTERARTFDDLRLNANRVAAWLRGKGVGVGDRVLILVPMSIELYEIILGVAQVGASCVFLDTWAGRAQIDAACAAAAPKVFFGIAKAHLLRLLSPAFRRIAHHVRVGGHWGGPYRRLLRTSPDSVVSPVSPDDAVLVAYTTGSTGRPKAVRRSHGYVARMLDALNQHEAKQVDEIDMPCWPILLFDGLCHGRTSVIPRFPPGKIAEADPAVILAQIRRRGVSLLTGSPAFFERLCDYCEATGETLDVRYAFAGGALVSERLIARVQAVMPRGTAYTVYGSTEVEPISHISAEEAIAFETPEASCVGMPHPYLSLKVIRGHSGPIDLDDGWPAWELPDGEIGEIVVSGTHVSVDYFEDADAFKQNKIQDAENKIWHRTGDSGYLWEGRIYLTGRLSASVNRGSGTLYPFPCEKPVLNLPGVRRAALMGMKDEAWMIVEADTGANSDEVLARVRELTASRGIERVKLVPKLPMDPRHNSKIDMDRLRADLREDR